MRPRPGGGGPRRLKYLQRAAGIDALHELGLRDRAGNRHDRRGVKDRVAPLDRPAHRQWVAHVALDEPDIGIAARQVRARARRQVVEHAHLVPARDECLDQMRSDEARAAGDENPHGSLTRITPNVTGAYDAADRSK